LLALLSAIVVGTLLLLVLRPSVDRAAINPLSLDAVAQGIRAGDIRAIEVTDGGGVATDAAGERFAFRLESGAPLLKALQSSYGLTAAQLEGVSYSVAEPPPVWLSALVGFVPLLLVVCALVFAWRWLAKRGGGSNPMQTFGRSHARRIDAAAGRSFSFADVAGVEEPSLELQEVVEFLREPAKFTALGARIPRGVLLVGPPGTGKTLLARAVAHEAGVPFFSISGSEFVEMFVGVGASRVRDLFDNARRSAPCIVFVDEIDAVGRQRGAGVGNANDEREQTLNQILVEMDGFDERAGVIVVAATNRPDVLDPALLRPGRFDRVVIVPKPDRHGRRAILDVHARGKALGTDVSLDTLADQTVGFSGADLANVLNEAAILTARRNLRSIGRAELEEALERVTTGPERRSWQVSRMDLERTAVREGGRALVVSHLAFHDPVYRITIVPRGARLGQTRFQPLEDRMYMTRSALRDTMTASLAGHAAEAVVFGDVSDGARVELSRATDIARRMVTRLGMSARLGPIAFGRQQQMIFLGRDLGEQRNYSARTGELIDAEIQRLLDEGYARATAVLVEHRAALDHLTRELLAQESLDAAAVKVILNQA
jgi:cell division protease FtsH